MWISSNTHFSDEWLSSLDTDLESDETTEVNESIRSNHLELIVEKIVKFYKEVLDKEVDESLVPKVKQIITDEDVDQMSQILDLLVGCAVNDEERAVIRSAIYDSNENMSEMAVNCLKKCTQNQSNDCLDENIINSNLSEEEVKDSTDVSNDDNSEKIESNSDIKSNSMISCPDIKAKESFAQLSNNDLEIEFNNKNQLLEENQKLMIENEKYKKLIERMNKNDISIIDPNNGSNGGTTEEVTAIKNQNQCLQNEIMKMKETEETYLVEMAVLREQLNHSKANHNHSEPLIWNRDAIAGFCDREYLYKLILR